jgi:hypothetical protein
MDNFFNCFDCLYYIVSVILVLLVLTFLIAAGMWWAILMAAVIAGSIVYWVYTQINKMNK